MCVCVRPRVTVHFYAPQLCAQQRVAKLYMQLCAHERQKAFMTVRVDLSLCELLGARSISVFVQRA